jgi:hypothetical protein
MSVCVLPKIKEMRLNIAGTEKGTVRVLMTYLRYGTRHGKENSTQTAHVLFY